MYYVNNVSNRYTGYGDRDSPSLAIFKSRLKTFLFRSAFSL